MRKKLLVILIVLLSLPAAARVSSIDLENLVERADLIAIVDVTQVQCPSAEEQFASFQSIRLLKGTLQDGHRLYRGHLPVCARPDYRPGRYLLFLKNESGNLVAAYHAYSVFEVKNNKLNWFEAPNSKRKLETSLERAEADIKQIVSED